ncbi:hypothetical protein RKD37_003609 [Streptomyces ambofaciens]|uniref:acyl-CoA carboxylase epsilon subunit n=1 Tax=unclassified Streptomyces TaxID=2593676 RepID=UPI0033E3DA16
MTSRTSTRTTTSTPSRAPFPLPQDVAATDASAVAQPPKPLLVFHGDPTPDEIAAVTAAILAVLPRHAPRPRTAGHRRARWSPPEVPTASWQRAG